MKKKPASGKVLTMPTITLNEADVRAMLQRNAMLERMFDPRRDIDAECGYPVNPSLAQYDQLYRREGIASRVVSIFPLETWSMLPEVLENEEDAKTDFENAWADLVAKHSVYRHLLCADELCGIGQYGVILLGFSDGGKLDEAVKGVSDESADGTGKAKLLYMRPLSQSFCKITKWDTDSSSPRCGKPAEYEIDLSTNDIADLSGSSVSGGNKVRVHWTRIIHIADNTKESLVYGEPRMRSVFKNLLDIRKVLAASGEGYWKAGIPGISFETTESAKDAQMDIPALKRQMEAYQNGTQRYMALTNMNAKPLTSETKDPTPWLNAQVSSICIALGVPELIFRGSQSAKLNSTADGKTWATRIDSRRSTFAEPCILFPFINRLCSAGALPKPKAFKAVWPDLNSPSEDDKATIAFKRTQSLANYVGSGANALIPPREWLIYVLGLPEAVAHRILLAAENPSGEDLLLSDLTEEPGAGTGTITARKGVGAGSVVDETQRREAGFPRNPKM